MRGRYGEEHATSSLREQLSHVLHERDAVADGQASFNTYKIQVAKNLKASHYQSSRYERTPELLAFHLNQLCGQRRPMNLLRCYMASVRSH
jgi:hypothetical protein